MASSPVELGGMPHVFHPPLASFPPSAIPNPPKILVLGATGGTERLIVKQALAKGYEMATLVRSPEKAADLKGTKLVVGDAGNEGDLRKALSVLGTPPSPFKEVTLLSTATRALIGAMKAEGVPRLAAITGIGAGDSVGHGGFAFDTQSHRIRSRIMCAALRSPDVFPTENCSSRHLHTAYRMHGNHPAGCFVRAADGLRGL